jgi:multidrug efflux pump subunit AcrA (membrane-fusion protein)
MSPERPRFRRDLEARPVFADGQNCVEVHDQAAGTSFLFYDFEYQVALAFDGLALDKVIPWVKLATGLALEVDQLREFAQRLDELGFLEREPASELEAPASGPSSEQAGASQTDTAPGADETREGVEASGSGEPSAPSQATGEDEPLAQGEALGGGEASPGVEPTGEVETLGDVALPREGEPAGPPEPDSVVMHPAEVVGETPPPVSALAGLAMSTDKECVEGELGERPARDEKTSTTDEEHSLAAEISRPLTDEPAELPQGVRTDAPAASGSVPEPVAEEGGDAGADAGTVTHAPDPGAASASIDAGQAGVASAAHADEPPAKEEALPPDPGGAGEVEPTADQATAPARGASGSADSAAFPVLPVTRSAPTEVPPVVAPPPWTTPRPLMMTPGPSSLRGDQTEERRRIRRSFTVFGTLGVLAAAALLAVVLPFLLSSRRPPLVEVRTVTAAPGTVYRYFDGAGTIAAMPGVALRFPTGGRVTRVVAKGSTVAAGDVVAAVEAARPLLDRLASQRERLAYYRQMAEAMHQVGNSTEEERQLAKLESRNARIAQTLSDLARVAVVADSAGEVEEAFAREGQTVEANSPALRLRSPGFRATFELSRVQAAAARRLSFCQVEVEGYLLDCSLVQPGGDNGRVTVALPSVPAALVGRSAHLARARYHSAVVVPLSALQTGASRTGVFVVSAGVKLEARPVVVADRSATEAVVVQGLDPGDKVVVEQSPALRPGMRVESRP